MLQKPLVLLRKVLQHQVVAEEDDEVEVEDDDEVEVEVEVQLLLHHLLPV